MVNPSIINRFYVFYDISSVYICPRKVNININSKKITIMKKQIVTGLMAIALLFSVSAMAQTTSTTSKDKAKKESCMKNKKSCKDKKASCKSSEKKAADKK
jgi:hypothetical protein